MEKNPSDLFLWQRKGGFLQEDFVNKMKYL